MPLSLSQSPTEQSQSHRHKQLLCLLTAATRLLSDLRPAFFETQFVSYIYTSTHTRKKLLPPSAHPFNVVTHSPSQLLVVKYISPRCLSPAATFSRSSWPSSFHLLVCSSSEVAARTYLGPLLHCHPRIPIQASSSACKNLDFSPAYTDFVFLRTCSTPTVTFGSTFS